MVKFPHKYHYKYCRDRGMNPYKGMSLKVRLFINNDLKYRIKPYFRVGQPPGHKVEYLESPFFRGKRFK